MSYGIEEVVKAIDRLCTCLPPFAPDEVWVPFEATLILGGTSHPRTLEYAIYRLIDYGSGELCQVKVRISPSSVISTNVVLRVGAMPFGIGDASDHSIGMATIELTIGGLIYSYNLTVRNDANGDLIFCPDQSPYVVGHPTGNLNSTTFAVGNMLVLDALFKVN